MCNDRRKNMQADMTHSAFTLKGFIFSHVLIFKSINCEAEAKLVLF